MAFGHSAIREEQDIKREKKLKEKKIFTDRLPQSNRSNQFHFIRDFFRKEVQCSDDINSFAIIFDWHKLCWNVESSEKHMHLDGY